MDSKVRSWTKSIVWRLIGVFILGAIVWLFTHSWAETTLITIVFHAIRTVLYYFHERVWMKISWGRNDIMPIELGLLFLNKLTSVNPKSMAEYYSIPESEARAWIDQAKELADELSD